MELRQNLTLAIMAYEGIQYQYITPGVFTFQELNYMEEHLRILSGFYGILRPFDGVTPYRLEMQARLKICELNNLYEYWNTEIYDELTTETDCIINLASKEYSRCVSEYLTEGTTLITCVFGERKGGKIIEKGTLCKMALGEMVRYMAEHQIEDPEQSPTHKARGLLWEFVGGKVENGETKEQALIRECREELAVNIAVGEVFMDVVHQYPDMDIHLTLFNATIAEGVPQKLEHNDIRWITADEVDQYEFCPADDVILDRLRSQTKLENNL